MADKFSTLVFKADLDCQRCYKKVRKVLCQLQDGQRIRSIAFDDKNNLVRLAGPFDAQKLSEKLNSKAGDVIKDILIEEGKKEKPKDAKPAGPPAQAPEKPKDKDKDKDSEKSKPAEPVAKPDPPKAEQLEQQKFEYRPPMGIPVVAQEVEWAFPAMWAGTSCGCGPSPDGWYRCYRCGREWGPPVVASGSYWEGSSKTREFFAEADGEDSSCVIM